MADQQLLDLGATMSEPVIRAYRPGDEVAINTGFNRVFNTSRELAEWGWKFPAEPAGRPIMLALDGEEVLAHYAGVPVRFHVDGALWPAVQIVDVFSARSARRVFSRRGVWVRTVEEFFSTFGASGRYPLLFGFPGRRALRLGVLQLGYDAMPPQPITYLSRTVFESSSWPSRLRYRAELARDWEPRLDQLWSRVRLQYPAAVVRDAERALRRLAGRPGVVYHRFLVFPRWSRVPVAWVAFRIDGGRCRWVDLLWDHRHRGALHMVSQLGRRLAGQVGAELEEIWLNGDDPGRSVLEGLGFAVADQPDGLVLVARSFSDELDVNRLDGRVYLTMADADLV
jgi:hypothetical protein